MGRLKPDSRQSWTAKEAIAAAAVADRQHRLFYSHDSMIPYPETVVTNNFLKKIIVMRA